MRLSISLLRRSVERKVVNSQIRRKALARRPGRHDELCRLTCGTNRSFNEGMVPSTCEYPVLTVKLSLARLITERPLTFPTAVRFVVPE